MNLLGDTTQARLFTPGDLKYSAAIADHGDWILMDGRALSSLSSDHQSQASILGLTIIPDGTNVILMMNGNPLGTISGNNQFSINQANLPAVTLTGTLDSQLNDIQSNHSHNGNAGIRYYALIQNGSAAMSGTPAAVGNGSADHHHSVTVSSGGSDTPVGFQLDSMLMNLFVYLGK